MNEIFHRVSVRKFEPKPVEQEKILRTQAARPMPRCSSCRCTGRKAFGSPNMSKSTWPSPRKTSGWKRILWALAACGWASLPCRIGWTRWRKSLTCPITSRRFRSLCWAIRQNITIRKTASMHHGFILWNNTATGKRKLVV